MMGGGLEFSVGEAFAFGGMAGLIVGLWVGSRLAARKFTSSARQPYGCEWGGRVYDVTERQLDRGAGPS